MILKDSDGDLGICIANWTNSSKWSLTYPNTQIKVRSKVRVTFCNQYQ